MVVSAGVATFSTLSIDNPGNGYTLVAACRPRWPPPRRPLSTSSGAATQVVFVQDPRRHGRLDHHPAGHRGRRRRQRQRRDRRQQHAGDASPSGRTPSHGTLIGGAATTVVDGVATFSGLSIDAAGTGYTLVATDAEPTVGDVDRPSTSPRDRPHSSPSCNSRPTPLRALSITPAVTVAVEDANGNVETVDNSTKVTLALGANPGSGTLSNAAATVADGVATFSDLSINLIGTGYTLVANGSSYTAVTSSPFDITEGQLTLSCAAPPAPQVSTCPTIAFPSVALDGNWQMAQSSANELYVTDNRGLSNVGWSVSAYLMPTTGNPNPACANVANFCNATVGASASGSDGQIPAENLLVTGINCTGTNGNANPDPQAGPGANFPSGSGAVELCSAAAGQSGGSFEIGAHYFLGIPPYIYAGQYQGTVEILAF